MLDTCAGNPQLSVLHSICCSRITNRIDLVLSRGIYSIIITDVLEYIDYYVRMTLLCNMIGFLIYCDLLYSQGCFVILESFYQYFQNMSQRSDQGEVMHLLVEALGISSSSSSVFFLLETFGFAITSV